MSRRRKVTLGVIGCGDVALRIYLPRLVEMPGVELVAVCDNVAGRAERARAQFGVPEAYGDAEEMLAKSDVEAVAILTSASAHAPLCLAALQAGKHVYTEKPLATDVATATRIIRLAKARKRKLVAAPTVMLSRPNQHIKHLLRAGLIGRLAFCRAHGSHGGAGAHGHIYDPTWYYKAEEGGGPLYDVTVYTLHALTGILGPAKRVTALSGCSQPRRPIAYTDDEGVWREKTERYTADDNTQLLLDWGNATFGTVDGTHCMVASRGPRMEFYGSAGVINLYGRPQAPLEMYCQRADLGLQGWVSAETPRSVPGLDNWGLADGVAHLVECIRSRRKPVPTGEHARHVIELIVAAYRAARTGRTQRLRTTF